MKTRTKDLLADVYRDDESFMLYLEHKEGLDDEDLITVFKKLIDEIPNLKPDEINEPEDQSGWS